MNYFPLSIPPAPAAVWVNVALHDGSMRWLLGRPEDVLPVMQDLADRGLVAEAVMIRIASPN